MTPMEAWLAELEMEVDEESKIIDNPCYQYERMEATFAEQLSTTLFEHFSCPYSSESNISSPEELDLVNIFMDPFTPALETFHNNDNNNNNNNNGDELFEASQQNNNDDKEVNKSKKKGAKRKRQPSQVQDHIIAERRRRELLAQLFISMSSLVPGLKKVDKTSVLGEAIKYMKQLKENVKTLEELVAKREVESMVVIKKSKVEVTYESGDNYSMVDDKRTSHNYGSNGGVGSGSCCVLNNDVDSLPKIEAKIISNKILLRIYCKNQKGIMTKLFGEFEKYDLSVTNCSVLPFESQTLDITIVAQMESGWNVNVRSFVKNVSSTIMLSSHK